MPNDTLEDIVKNHAESKKQENATGEQSQQQNNEQVSEEGKAALQQQQDEEKETARLADVEKVKGEATQEFLKELGVSSLDELKEKLSAKGSESLSPEEKEKAQEIYEANLQKFAVEKDLMGIDDFSQLKTLKSRQDAELVFDKYLEDWKEENPDITEDIEELAKEEFEKDYKLNHDNEKIKGRGIAKLADAAAAIRNPLLSSYNTAKEQFDAETDLRTNFPKFTADINKIATELVPQKMEWFKGKDGEDEVAIEIDIPEEDRKDIHDKVVKRLSNPDSYELFKGGKLGELKEGIADYVDYLVNKKSKEIGNAKIAEIFLGRGIEKGSIVGANNSFAANQGKAAAHNADKKSKTDSEQEILEQFGTKK